jgi:transmembrane sensor
MLGPLGIAAEVGSASVDDLFALADVARLSGHPGDAVPPLQHIVSDHRTDARAPLAALTLGRVQLRSLGLPADAAAALDAAIALGLPIGLGEDADALLVEAYARAHEPARARAVYEHYVQAFPSGSKRGELERWVTAR